MLKNKTKSSHNKFFKIVFLSIIMTRTWTLSLFTIFAKNPKFIERFTTDPFHHYQMGLILILISLPLRKFVKSYLISGIGLGMLLEELPVLLDDLGLGTLKYYHSGWDIIIITLLTYVTYKLIQFKFKKFTKNIINDTNIIEEKNIFRS